VFDIGEHGLSHQVPAEEGYVLPGTLYLGSDTQSPTMGALGCVALAQGSPVAAVLGETWLRVPESIRFHLTGQLPKGITGKDVFMRVMQLAGDALISRAVEYVGPGLDSIGVDFRMTMCNGMPIVGGMVGIINPDAKTLEFVTPRAREPFEVLRSDPDAEYAAEFELNLDDLEPLVGFPPDPSNVHQLSEIEGTNIDQAYIGSCSTGRLDDLALAAEVVRGRKVQPGVRFIVTPISSRVMQDAMKLGILADLAAAGATITTPGCGACYAGNQSPGGLMPGEVCITSSVENVPGRMGSTRASIYIANTAVVAASAVEGKITDPRKYLGD
jgi:3-isopropylmalate/(R)-2-methylmalate dehydratase large subunit